MSLKKSQEIGSYMDEVKVKIAEEYKPPPKINILMTHTQRLTFNKQIQDSLPKYDFSMENSVLQKVREWKNNRLMNEEQRKLRLQALKEKELAEESESETEDSPEKELEVPITSYEKEVVVSSVGPSCTTAYSNGMLFPTKASNYYSNILQPIPLNSDNHKFANATSEIKSPFNISEFEADTSSPFDNVALKSINDVEELAKVLKLEDTSITVSYSNFQTPNVHTFPNYSSGSNFPNSASYNTQHPVMNGYYNSSDIGTIGSFPLNFQCSPPLNNYITSCGTNSFIHQENTLLNDERYDKNINFSILSSKKIPESYITRQGKSETGQVKKLNSSVENLPDPFDELPKHLQELSKKISSMGFPLSRVARTCKAIGSDNKKVVDHLLAMSELLDLGFAEDKVSEALLLFDNDRDKALDKLIS